MGLHKQSLDFIKTKSKNYLDQMTRYKDSESRTSAMKSRERDSAKMPIQYAITARDAVGQLKSNSTLKVKSARDFLMNIDKLNTGMTPVQNFVKVARIFGLQINQGQIPINEVGMVEYESVLAQL